MKKQKKVNMAPVIKMYMSCVLQYTLSVGEEVQGD